LLRRATSLIRAVFCISSLPILSVFFFFIHTPTPEIYTLSLHRRSSDLLRDDPHRHVSAVAVAEQANPRGVHRGLIQDREDWLVRSEEHTSELQSQSNLVCRLLLEKKKKKNNTYNNNITQ